MAKDNGIKQPQVAARIAVYDDLLAAPRIVDIEPCDIRKYISDIASKTYELAQNMGGSIPFAVIQQVCENFIHAQFKEPCVSILESGNTIRFTDQGPGIVDKEAAQRPGFTTATSQMREYIYGVGSGLPTVREYLKFSNGHLTIEDNLKEGTVVTITIDTEKPQPQPVVYRENIYTSAPKKVELAERDREILELAAEIGLIGPTEVNQNLGIANATAHRALKKLEELGLLKMTDARKRILTDEGFALVGGR